LLRYHPEELSDLEFDPIQSGLDSLLKNVGSRVETFFRDLSNTSSREQVLLQSLTPTGRVQRSKREFYYLILPGETGLQWKEDRTDKKGRSVSQDQEIRALRGFCISSGYAHLCLYLHPTYQAGSRFRYLGRRISEPRAHVIAFAQRPDAGDYLTSYSDLSLSITVPFLVQGFLWINPDNYQILRMRTNMLSPNMFLREQTTDISYTEIRFDGVPQPFWLPRQVAVSWELPGGMIFRNEHLYSDYRLFAVESDYKISKPPAK